MPDAFVFRKVLYLVEATGHSARDLNELLRVVTVADATAIGYHMHREFLAYRSALSEWPNDFAYFAAKILGDVMLAERLANLRLFRHASIAGVQREIAWILADHLSGNPAAGALRAPPGREFYLCSARRIVMPAKRTARDLPELTGAIAEIESSSLYYHLFDSRYDEAHARRPNDFASWIEGQLGRPRLAERVAAFDPYMYSLEQARRVLLRILAEAQAEGEA